MSAPRRNYRPPKHVPIQVIKDWTGQDWNVYVIRPTPAGIALMLGRPYESSQKGNYAYIITIELAEYLRITRPKDNRLQIDSTAIGRLNRILGIAWIGEKWWREREDDVLSMPLEDFCTKHGCSVFQAEIRYAQIATEGYQERPNDRSIGLERVLDWQGEEWIVRHTFTTPHGFSVYQGWQQKKGSQGLSKILTSELAEYLRHIRPYDPEFNLPIEYKVIHRMRKELGLSYTLERSEWWTSRKDDLLSLSPNEFATKHGVTPEQASNRRKQFLAYGRYLTHPEAKQLLPKQPKKPKANELE